MQLDGLGTGEVCPLPENQHKIINELLLADDARFVRAMRCKHFWDALTTRADVTASVSIDVDSDDEPGSAANTSRVHQ